MKWVMNRSGGDIGHGRLNKWAGCALGVVLFVSAGGAVASAQTAITQKQYLQRMANICGALLGSATDADLINWARGKGLGPTGGWIRANAFKNCYWGAYHLEPFEIKWHRHQPARPGIDQVT